MKNILLLWTLLVLTACGQGFESLFEENAKSTTSFKVIDANQDGIFQQNEIVTLMVEAKSNAPIKYQWRRSVGCGQNLENIAGATNSAVQVSVTDQSICYYVNLKLNNSTYYSVDVFVEEIRSGLEIVTPVPTPTGTSLPVTPKYIPVLQGLNSSYATQTHQDFLINLTIGNLDNNVQPKFSWVIENFWEHSTLEDFSIRFGAAGQYKVSVAISAPGYTTAVLKTTVYVSMPVIVTPSPTVTPKPTVNPKPSSTPTPTTTTSASASDFTTRCAQPGVVRCVGLDSPSEIEYFRHEKTGKTNYLDTNVKASGNGSIRFEIPSNSYDNVAGSLGINFSEDLQAQFGENTEFWVQWRQRFDKAYITNRYLYDPSTGKTGYTDWKQAIVGEGDRYLSNGTKNVASSCTQLELVMQSTWRQSGGYPLMYMTCGEYNAFQDQLPDFNTYYNYTLQNQRLNSSNKSSCTLYEDRGDSDITGCLRYVENEWMTFMIHVKLGAYGTAYSKHHDTTRTGFTNSTIEFFVGREGGQLLKAHTLTNTVIPNSDKSIKYGKVWLLPYTSYKDPNQSFSLATTWYDDLIISKNYIATPSSSGAGVTTLPSPTITPKPTSTATPTPTPKIVATPTPVIVVANGLPIAPTWVSNLTKGQWYSIGSNTIRSNDPCPARNCKYSATEGVSGVVDDWNSGIFASNLGNSGTYIVYGGGHKGYWGNEVYGFDLSSQKWNRLTDPYSGAFSYPLSNGLFSDNTPGPIHTNDKLEYRSSTNSLYVFGREINDSGGNTVPYASFLNLTTPKLSNRANWTNDTNSADQFGGTYDTACYDSDADLFWLASENIFGGTSGAILSYDPKKPTGSKVAKYTSAKNYGAYYLATADCAKGFMLLVQESRPDWRGFYVSNLRGSPGDTIKLDLGSNALSVIGATANPGLSWSERRQAYLLWNNGTNLYEIRSGGSNYSAWQWGQITTSASNSSAVPNRNGNGTFNRFRVARFSNGEELAMVVNSVDGKVHVLRIP